MISLAVFTPHFAFEALNNIADLPSFHLGNADSATFSSAAQQEYITTSLLPAIFRHFTSDLGPNALVCGIPTTPTSPPPCSSVALRSQN
ncbi:hypothetical protein CEXT_282241 [Caerostris extrusa]|uniref:Uncharacterized protein n=1 Tax=Caerostris extrusa TaxID=172846 RepID=A0AAV4WC23_CAEEX|nr:hypothetical protein CEXT_282241 [Caerostris extrusa]